MIFTDISKRKKTLDIQRERTNIKIFTIDCPSTDGLIKAERFEIKSNQISEETPLILYFGGKNWNGDSDEYQFNYCTHLCNITQSMVIKIDTSPAPLYKFPNACDECYDAIKWVWQACSFWKINREKIYIFAETCGANNTLSALIKLRDEKIKIDIAGIILVDPLIDCRFIRLKEEGFDSSGWLNISELKRSVDEYTNDATEIFNPKLSLILHKDWTRLSNILLLSAKKSPLWCDSLSLYHRVNESEGNIIFYPLENTQSGFLYKKHYKEKKIVERLICTFVSNNDPSYFKLVFKD